MRNYIFDIVVIIFFSLFMSTFIILYDFCTVSYEIKPVKIIVKKGSGLGEIAHQLEKEHVIKSADLFIIAAKLTNMDTKLKYGTYKLPKNISIIELLKILQRGERELVKIKILPGYTAEQVGDLLEKKIGIKKSDFMNVLTAPQMLNYLGYNCAKSLEGFLYPDIYKIPKDEKDVQSITKILIDNFHKKIHKLDLSRMDSLDLTLCEVVNLAAIVNYEVLHWDEAWKIASVYYNRLKKGWLLQSDPTVLYALHKHKKRLYFKDLKIDSPYNTYKNKGLPPTPIGNPDLRSIKAVLNIKKDFPYYYFVAQKNGYHIFSKTNAEHNRAKQKIKRERRK